MKKLSCLVVLAGVVVFGMPKLSMAIVCWGPGSDCPSGSAFCCYSDRSGNHGPCGCLPTLYKADHLEASPQEMASLAQSGQIPLIPVLGDKQPKTSSQTKQ